MPHASTLPAVSPERFGPVLLVDAAADNRSLYHHYREQVGGISVREAASGSEAIAALDDGLAPSVVVFDVALPKVDGFALCQHVRRTAQCRDTALVALTGYPLNVAECERLWGLGVAALLPKPYAPDQLLAHVRLIIERKQAFRAAAQTERPRLEACRDRARALQSKAEQLQTSIAEVCQDEDYRTLYHRIQAEYREMPCLALSLPQASRLWNLPHNRCAVLFGDLVRDGFLRETAQGTYRRVGR